jgi:hypothetical protein
MNDAMSRQVLATLNEAKIGTASSAFGIGGLAAVGCR